MNDYHEQNRASAVLAKIGGGSADADFARAMATVLDRVRLVEKSAKLVLTISVTPRKDLGCVELRAHVEAKLPKLIPPASQMHLGPAGELLSQMDFLMGGGPSEAKPQPVADARAMPQPVASASGRLPAMAARPAPAALADAPQPAPLVGKDAAAGK